MRKETEVLMLLRWRGEELLVRPDRVIAKLGTLPHYSTIEVSNPGDAHVE